MTPMPWAVLVTGSREWTDPKPMIAFLRRFEVAGGVGPTLLHGNCEGADLLAESIVERCSVPWIVHKYPAPWKADDKDGKPLGGSAGPMRNRVMVNQLVVLRSFGYRTAVGAFPLKPRGGGTWDCVTAARGAGFDPEIFGRQAGCSAAR